MNASFGLTEQEAQFCANHLYPISGISDHEAGAKARMVEANARSNALAKFQRKNGLNKKQAAEFFGVSSATYAKWLSLDVTPPAAAAYAATKATT